MESCSINRKLWICILTLLGVFCCIESENVIPVRETEPVTLACIVHETGVDGRKVKWFKGSEMVSIDRIVIKFRTSLEVLRPPPPNEWNLRILRVTNDFADEYTCKVNEVPYTVVRVVVEAAPTIVDAESSPLNVIQPEYSDVTLNCKVSGYPKAQIFWSRKSKGGVGSITDLGIMTEELTIVNASRYAEDIYICMAENTYGSVQKEISLTISFPPEVMLFKPEAEAENEDVTMACIVASSPLNDSFWRYENGDPINSNFKYILNIESEAVYPVRYMTLTLRKGNWNDADYGQYTCYVSNGTMTSVKHFTLKRPTTVKYDIEEKVIKYDKR